MDWINLPPQVITIAIVCVNQDPLKIVSVIVVIMIMNVEVLRLIVKLGVNVITLVVTLDKNVKVTYVTAKDVAKEQLTSSILMQY